VTGRKKGEIPHPSKTRERKTSKKYQRIPKGTQKPIRRVKMKGMKEKGSEGKVK